MRSLTTLCGILLTVVLAAVVAGCGSDESGSSGSGDSSAWRKQTLTFKFGKAKERRFKVGKKEVNFGDRLVSQFDLMQGKKSAGYVSFHCASRTPEEGTCEATFNIGGDQIATVSSQQLKGSFPISGGTGRFLGALGEWKSDPSGKITLNLLLPEVGD